MELEKTYKCYNCWEIKEGYPSYIRDKQEMFCRLCMYKLLSHLKTELFLSGIAVGMILNVIILAIIYKI